MSGTSVGADRDRLRCSAVEHMAAYDWAAGSERLGAAIGAAERAVGRARWSLREPAGSAHDGLVDQVGGRAADSTNEGLVDTR
ncbi:hypothetical protein [Promicromonospora soli]